MKNINTFEKYHSTYETLKLYEGEELCKCGNVATHIAGLNDIDAKNNVPMCEDCYNRWWIETYIAMTNPVEFEVTPIKKKKIILKKRKKKED